MKRSNSNPAQLRLPLPLEPDQADVSVWIDLKEQYPHCVIFVQRQTLFITADQDARRVTELTGLPLVSGSQICVICSNWAQLQGCLKALARHGDFALVALEYAEGCELLFT